MKLFLIENYTHEKNWNWIGDWHTYVSQHFDHVEHELQNPAIYNTRDVQILSQTQVTTTKPTDSNTLTKTHQTTISTH